jgi:hypothetical protein
VLQLIDLCWREKPLGQFEEGDSPIDRFNIEPELSVTCDDACDQTIGVGEIERQLRPREPVRRERRLAMRARRERPFVRRQIAVGRKRASQQGMGDGEIAPVALEDKAAISSVFIGRELLDAGLDRALVDTFGQTVRDVDLICHRT